MVVEDESIVRLDIVEMLKDAGYDVIASAGNGEKAVELAYSNPPDLIIMDIKMPKLNGLKASKIIGSKLHTPILLLTAYSQQEFIEKAKQPNIVGYLVKPISEARLIPAVEIALKQADYQNNLREKAENVNKELQNRKIIERAKGLLMTHLQASEEAAYKKLRKMSMDHQVSLDQIAENVIIKYQT
jgi:response regulator NasT